MFPQYCKSENAIKMSIPPKLQNMDQQLADVESLTVCTFCQQKFNGTDHCPKLLNCKHYFCLKCIETRMLCGEELNCVNCWKRQTFKGDAKALTTHKAILSLANHLTTLGFSDLQSKSTNGCSNHGLSWTLWCHSCQKPLCRLCFQLIEHDAHQITTYGEARILFHAELLSELGIMTKFLQEIQRLSCQQRDFQLRILEACMSLKSFIETDLAVSSTLGNDLLQIKELLSRSRLELASLSSPNDIYATCLTLAAEKPKLEARYQELTLQGKLEETISRSGVILDLATLSALQSSDWLTRDLHSPGLVTNVALPHPILLLANYCTYQMLTRSQGGVKLANPVILLRNPTNNIHPRYYFIVEINQLAIGRFIIETRPDLAPKMSNNFGALCIAENGPTYKNCSVFQCWEGESIITGDYELNNGRGGKALYEEGYFMPDETKMAAVRGAVGMRRTQKRHDNFGLVGSQFRIILNDMRGFSAIFGQVIDGIEIIEKIASCGDQTGKPTKMIVITACGQA